MTDWRFFSALLGVPLVGLAVQRCLFPRSRNTCARLGFSAAAGAVLLCFEMLLLTSVGIPWSVWLLSFPALLLLLGPGVGGSPFRAAAGAHRMSAFDILLILVTLGVVAYATATARATGGDFLLFWGAKGEHFGLSRSIDVGYLRDPLHFQMHPTYPPLVPLLYAWGTMVAGRLSWEAGLLTMPLFLSLTGCAFLGFAEPLCGRRRAATLTAVLVAMLGLVMIAVPVAGNAEPLLLYFETVSLVALLFRPTGERGFLAAGVGLAGAAMTKIEGCIFAVLVICAHLVFGRDRSFRALASLVTPPLIMVGGWFAFCHAHGISGRYELPTASSVRFLPLIVGEMGRQASFGVGYVPWIAAVLIGIGGRWSSESRTAAVVAIGFAGAMICIYLGARQDPRLWILWSAGRLFMTPLLCCFLASVAARLNPGSCPGELAEITTPTLHP